MNERSQHRPWSLLDGLMRVAYRGEHKLPRLLADEIRRTGASESSVQRTMERARKDMSRPIAVHFEEMSRGANYDVNRVVGEWRAAGVASMDLLERVALQGAAGTVGVDRGGRLPGPLSARRERRDRRGRRHRQQGQERLRSSPYPHPRSACAAPSAPLTAAGGTGTARPASGVPQHPLPDGPSASIRPVSFVSPGSPGPSIW